MRKLHILLLMLFITCSYFCQGQTLFNENGILLQYDGNEKIGSRYDEYCKTTFDVYRVKATVINKNTDKAATIKAILNFNGFTCNKIYSDNGPASGEVISKVYTLNIPLQTKHVSPYWVNSYVSLSSVDEMTAYGEVEVKHGEPCPTPEPIFSYELIPGAGKKADSEPADVQEKATAGKIIEKGSTTINASHVIGEWTLMRVVLTYKTGKVEEVTDKLSDYLAFEAGGKGRAMGNEYSDELKWEISGNNLKLSYEDEEPNNNEIIKLNETSLVLKRYAEKNDETGVNYRVYTYKRGMN